jgi:hypothetical protein
MIGRRGTWLSGLVLGLAMMCTATPSVAREADRGQKKPSQAPRGSAKSAARTPCAHVVRHRAVKPETGRRKIRRCSLIFATQPQDVQVGSPITGAQANPSGPPVTIFVRDRGGHPTKAAIRVTIRLGTAPAGAQLSGTRTVTSVNGVARFTDLSVNAPGRYTLTATSPAAVPAAASTSQPFVAAQGLASCANDAPCTASATTTGIVPGSRPPTRYTNSVRVAARPNPAVRDDSGTLSVSYDVGPDIACRGYSFASPDREAVLGPNREKRVVSTVSKALLDATGRTPSSLRTCLLAPYRFNLGLPLIGGTARNVGDVDRDGNTDYLGLLPNCLELLDPILGIPILIEPPCQESAVADSEGNGVVTYRLPPDPRDPLGRH